MRTKCIIIDDEPLARELIRGHVKKLENFEIVAECANAMEAMETLRNNKTDLMFLDIKMPQISGIEFLKTIKNPPKVIITTAFSQYAIEGFEMDVVDYLIKPVTFERFFKAVNKFFATRTHQEVTLERENQVNDHAFIYVKENKKIIKIYLKEIHFIEGLNEYIRIHTDNRRVVVKAVCSPLKANYLRSNSSGYTNPILSPSRRSAHSMQLPLNLKMPRSGSAETTRTRSSTHCISRAKSEPISDDAGRMPTLRRILIVPLHF